MNLTNQFLSSIQSFENLQLDLNVILRILSLTHCSVTLRAAELYRFIRPDIVISSSLHLDRLQAMTLFSVQFRNRSRNIEETGGIDSSMAKPMACFSS